MTDPGPAGDRAALDMLGIARRAGRLAVGTEAVRSGVEAGEIDLVVMARDAGENARGRIVPAAEAAGVPVAEGGTRSDLGAALGRAPTVTVGVADPGLAREVRERLDGETSGRPGTARSE